MGMKILIRNYLGGLFYLIAGAYLLLTNLLSGNGISQWSFITAAAVLACLILTGLTLTKYRYWSAFGGGMVIAGSLFLQSLLSYRCVYCMRADVLIFIGMLVLVLQEKGRRYGRLLRVTGLAVALFLTFNIAVHYDVKTITGLDSVIVIGETNKNDCTQAEIVGGKLEVVSADSKAITLEVDKKPILLFSSTCGACVDAIEALVKNDSKGSTWIPVLAYGDMEKGMKLLRDKGYSGGSYTLASDWNDMVPALLTTNSEGKVISTASQKEMLELINKGGAN